jgi:ankyrin repeat protein
MGSHEVDPVHRAVMSHSLSELKRAIADGNQVNVPDREGRTALFYAAQDGELEIVAELISSGANVNAQDRTLKTPLHFAAGNYQRDVAELLLRSRAHVNAADSHGNTPLSDAVFGSRGRGELIQLLLSHGADRTLKNLHGVSPQDLARSIGNYDVAKFI